MTHDPRLYHAASRGILGENGKRIGGARARDEDTAMTTSERERGSVRRKAAAIAAGGLMLLGLGTAKYLVSDVSEVDLKRKVTVDLDQGDTAASVAAAFNPNEDYRNEQDYIFDQLDEGEPIGTQQVEVPYTTIPEEYQDNIVEPNS